MREIKFRAFYKNKFRFFTLDEAMQPDFYGDENICQQYTGLKDKNGVEIYEGDIVLLDNDQKEWDVVYCKLTQCPSVRLLAKYGMNIYTFDELHADDRLDKIKVIGNIQQNPELLRD